MSTSLQTEGDLGAHVGELPLDELVGCEGSPELPPLQRVIAGDPEARLGGTERAPRNPVPRHVQAAEGTCQALGPWQQALAGCPDIVHRDRASDRRTQAQFAFDPEKGTATTLSIKSG